MFRAGSLHSKKIGNINLSYQANNVTITTDHLVFKSFNQFTLQELTQQANCLYGNPENVKMYRTGKPWTDSMIEEFINEHAAKWNAGNKFSYFAVHDANSGAFIGHMGVYFPIQVFANIGAGHKDVAELVYIIDQKSWGRGYGTVMGVVGKKYINDLVTHPEANQTLPVELDASVDPANRASVRILEKIFKHHEGAVFDKYPGCPRMLFFTPLKNAAGKTKQEEIDRMKSSYDYATTYQRIVKERLEKQPEGTLSAEDREALQYATDYLNLGYDYAVAASVSRECAAKLKQRMDLTGAEYDALRYTRDADEYGIDYANKRRELMHLEGKSQQAGTGLRHDDISKMHLLQAEIHKIEEEHKFNRPGKRM